MRIVIPIVEWLRLQQHRAEETLDSIRGDSTPVNTGREGGAFTCIERLLGQKKMWLVRMPHTNEPPLRHLIMDLDGMPSGDSTLSGPTGKRLRFVTELDTDTAFPRLKIGPGLIELDKKVVDDLTTDQRCAYRMASAIREGEVPPISSAWRSAQCATAGGSRLQTVS